VTQAGAEGPAPLPVAREGSLPRPVTRTRGNRLARRDQHRCRSRVQGISAAAGPAHVRALPPPDGHVRGSSAAAGRVRAGAPSLQTACAHGCFSALVAPARGISALLTARARGSSPVADRACACARRLSVAGRLGLRVVEGVREREKGEKKRTGTCNEW
jgi:hypothetical protein